MNMCLKQSISLLLLSSSLISVTSGLNCGDIAAPGQFPSVVFISKQNNLKNNGTRENDCAGAIINTNWIVTTAQCVSGQLPNNVKVHVGTNRKDSTSGTAFDVAKIIVHQQFTNHTFLINNIAMVKIDGAFEFGSVLKPANIGNIDDFNYYFSDFLTATSWATSDTMLHYTKMLIVDYEPCSMLLDKAGFFIPKKPGQFCTVISVECDYSEDVGGPLFGSVDQNLEGLISYSVKIWPTALVMVNTAVKHYKNWIDDVIRHN